MDDIEAYLINTRYGISMRAIARGCNTHASTILRKIGRVEEMRDDPFADAYLDQLELETYTMDMEIGSLRLLNQPRTLIAAAEGMGTAIISQATHDNQLVKLGTVSTMVLGEWLVRGWVTKTEGAKVSKYKITKKGIKTCKDDAMSMEDEPRKPKTRTRINNETPLAILSRRKDRDGKPYITTEEYAAGVRLYHDFVQSKMPHGNPATINWDSLGAQVDHSSSQNLIPISWFNNGTANAFEEAIKGVGIGLADILLLCVCYELGLEQCEKRLGWSARSGKVVLKIALDRLVTYYGDISDDLIG